MTQKLNIVFLVYPGFGHEPAGASIYRCAKVPKPSLLAKWASLASHVLVGFTHPFKLVGDGFPLSRIYSFSGDYPMQTSVRSGF